MDEEEYRKFVRACARNRRAREYLDRFATGRAGWEKWVFGQIGFFSGADVLELGCGSASMWAQNIRRVPKDMRITLTDISRAALALAEKSLGPDAGRFLFYAADAERIPFRDELFDIVIANRMLYFTDPRKTCAQVKRVLKPGGRFYTATVGERNMEEIVRLYFDFFSVADRTRRTVASVFGLEGGAELLGEYFSGVQTRQFAQRLAVTQSAPLVEYVRSANSVDTSYLTAKGARAFRAHLDGLIARQGFVCVTKHSGLLIAVK